MLESSLMLMSMSPVKMTVLVNVEVIIDSIGSILFSPIVLLSVFPLG